MRVETRQTADAAGVVRPRSVNSTVSNEAHETASEQEPPAKRIKVEEGAASVRTEGISQPQTANIPDSKTLLNSRVHHTSETSGIGQSSVVTNSPVVSNSSGSSSVESLHPQATAAHSVVPPPAPSPLTANPSVESSPTMVPLKSTMMAHLQTKYLNELEYMLLEFRKLERQLLGAKGAAQIEESAGSRERREKLHSFILHLEDTIRQVEEGCRLEEGEDDASAPLKKEGSTGGVTATTESSTPETLAKKKETEESVQKLEEHILANLLPVKVRLKKQLAAQQGATRNPAGMPAPRRGSYVASSSAGTKGTFAAAAEQRRKQAEAARLAAEQQQEEKIREVSDPTQFGTPLNGGSSLTRNLHGATLGSKQRKHGHGVGASTNLDQEPINGRILYGGMVPESSQHRSGVAAASGVHEMVIENPSLMTPTESAEKCLVEVPEVASHPTVPLQSSTPVELPTDRNTLKQTPPPPKVAPTSLPVVKQPKPAPVRTIKIHEPETENSEKFLTEEERRKMRKKRRKRKLLRIAKRRERERQRLVVTQPAHPAHIPIKIVGGGRKKANLGKNNGRKKGPRAVEYICALCNDPYNSTCDYNPWWALAQQECPKCRKVQIPRIDITAPANQIEYHPALLAHIDDNGGNVGAPASVASQFLPKSPPPLPPHARLVKPIQNSYSEPSPPGSDSDSDLSELSDGSLSDLSVGSNDSEFDLSSLTPAEQAEHETFGHKYKGPVLSDDHASRLLVLMQHSSTCPCRHKSKRHRDVCRSVKYMMLHVRDCPGSTSNFDVCPFPWCRKVKHLLYHLVSCCNPDQCKICSPTSLSPSLQALDGLNQFRAKKYRERLITFMKRSAAARRAAVALAYSNKSAGIQPPYITAKGASTLKPSTAIYSKHPPRSLPPGAIALKGKKCGIHTTLAGAPVTHCKPTSATVGTCHPWTEMQNGAPPTVPPKQIRAPIPHQVQSSKGTKQNAVTTQSVPGIKRVVQKAPAPPTYTTVEDPLRASAAEPVQTPVQAGSPSSSGITLAVSKPVAPLGANDASKAVSVVSISQAASNVESNPITLVPGRPVASLLSQQAPSEPLHPGTFPPGGLDPTKRAVHPLSSPTALEQSLVSPSLSGDGHANRDASSKPSEQALDGPSSQPKVETGAVLSPIKEVAYQPGVESVSKNHVTKAVGRQPFEHQASMSNSLSGDLPVPLQLTDQPTSGPVQMQGKSSPHGAPVPPNSLPDAAANVQSTPKSVAASPIPVAESADVRLKVGPLHAPAKPPVSITPVVASAPVAPLSSANSTKHPAFARSSHVTIEQAAGTVETLPASTRPTTNTATPTGPPTVSETPLSEILKRGVPAQTINVTDQPTSGALEAHSKPTECSTTLSEASMAFCPGNPIASVHTLSPPGAGPVQAELRPPQRRTAVTATETDTNVSSAVHSTPAASGHVKKPPFAGSLKTQSNPTKPSTTAVETTAPATGIKVELETSVRSTVHPAATASSINLTNLSGAEPMKTEQVTNEPPTNVPATMATPFKPQSNVNSTTRPAVVTLSSEVAKLQTVGPVQHRPKSSAMQKTTHRSSSQEGTTIPKSSSASRIAHTKLESGRPMPTNATEHDPVESRKVEQSADTVQVGG